MRKELIFASEEQAIQYLANFTGKRIKIALYGDTAVSTQSFEQTTNDFVQNIVSVAEEKAVDLTNRALNSAMQNAGFNQKQAQKLKDRMKIEKKRPSSEEIIKWINKDLDPIDDSPLVIADKKNERALWSAVGNSIAWKRTFKDKSLPGKIKDLFSNIVESRHKDDIISKDELAQKMSDDVVENIIKKPGGDILASPELLLNGLKRRLFNYASNFYRDTKKIKEKEPEVTEREEIKSMSPKAFTVKILEDKETMLEFLDYFSKNHKEYNQKMILPLVEIMSRGGLNDIKISQLYREDKKKWNKYGITKDFQLRNIIAAIKKAIVGFVDSKKKELSFASEEQAIQYLANFTGTKIKIANK